MFRKLSLLLTAIFLLSLLPGISAQDDDNPTIAILRFGPIGSATTAESALLDVLQVYGFINAEERMSLMEGQDFIGENINIVRGDANYDLPSANVIVEAALDQGADVLVAFTTPVAQIAVNTTLDQDEPTPVIFGGVYNPYRAGIAEAACIKPDHVTGTESVQPYDEAFQIFLMQNPDLKLVGTIYSSNEASGIYGAERISEIGESLGITVESVAVTSVSDLRAAAQSLVNMGIEALVLPSDYTVTNGLPIIAAAANDNAIPVFQTTTGAIFQGATLGAGYWQHFEQGRRAGLMLAAWLNGELDIAATAIDSHAGMAVSVNMNAASELGIDIAEELIETADFLIQDESVALSERIGLGMLRKMGANEAILQAARGFMATIPLEDMGRGQFTIPPELANFLIESRRAEEFMAADAAYLASLQCTEEMIAEQQAALDAAGG